jgi:hypothetical protein
MTINIRTHQGQSISVKHVTGLVMKPRTCSGRWIHPQTLAMTLVRRHGEARKMRSHLMQISDEPHGDEISFLA